MVTCGFRSSLDHLPLASHVFNDVPAVLSFCSWACCWTSCTMTKQQSPNQTSMFSAWVRFVSLRNRSVRSMSAYLRGSFDCTDWYWCDRGACLVCSESDTHPAVSKDSTPINAFINLRQVSQSFEMSFRRKACLPLDQRRDYLGCFLGGVCSWPTVSPYSWSLCRSSSSFSEELNSATRKHRNG